MNSGNSNYFNYSNKFAFALFPSDPLFSVSILSRLSITSVHRSDHTLSSFYSQKRRFEMRNAHDSFDRRSKYRYKIIAKIRGNLLEFTVSVAKSSRHILAMAINLIIGRHQANASVASVYNTWCCIGVYYLDKCNLDDLNTRSNLYS